MFTNVSGKYNGEKFGRLISDDGLTANLFHSGTQAFKVFNADFDKADVFKEAYIMSCIERLGLDTTRVARVFCEGGHWIIEMNYIAGPVMLESLIQAITGNDMAEVDRLIDEMAALQHRINTTKAYGLPCYKNYAADAIANNPALTPAQVKRTLAYLGKLPDGDGIVHGDFHPINIMYDDGKPTVIDWFQAGAGATGCDAARTYLNLRYPPVPELQREGVALHKRYLDAYIRQSGLCFGDLEIWFPVFAALTIGGRDPEFSKAMVQYLL